MKTYITRIIYSILLSAFLFTTNAKSNETELYSAIPSKSEYPSYDNNNQYHAFSNELPSDITYEEVNSYDARNSMDDLDDDPNGQGPGIGTLPVNNSPIAIIFTVLLYGLFKIFQSRNKRLLNNKL